jgi:hypothetical protein
MYSIRPLLCFAAYRCRPYLFDCSISIATTRDTYQSNTQATASLIFDYRGLHFTEHCEAYYRSARRKPWEGAIAKDGSSIHVTKLGHNPT